MLINGIRFSQSECPCVCVGWSVIGGIFFYKQRQDLRDYGLGLFNGECKRFPQGNKVPANSGSASLHNFKSLNIPSLYDWPHTASQSQRLLHLVQSPSPLSHFLPGVFVCRRDPSEVTPIPSLIGCPWKDVGARRRLIISCFLMRWSRGRNTWISVRDHYC